MRPFLCVVEERESRKALSSNRKRHHAHISDFRRSKTAVDVAVAVKPTHLTFEVVQATPVDAIDGVLWGPYPTSISATVGDIVGVVR